MGGYLFVYLFPRTLEKKPTVQPSSQFIAGVALTSIEPSGPAGFTGIKKTKKQGDLNPFSRRGPPLSGPVRFGYGVSVSLHLSLPPSLSRSASNS